MAKSHMRAEKRRVRAVWLTFAAVMDKGQHRNLNFRPGMIGHQLYSNCSIS